MITPRARRAFAWLPVAGWIAAEFALSSIPGRLLSRVPHGVDKLAHAVVFGVLAALVARAQARAAGPWRRVMIAVTVAAAYGVFDEVHQAFVPGRSSDVLDVCADVVGALAGAAAWTRRSMRGSA